MATITCMAMCFFEFIDKKQENELLNGIFMAGKTFEFSLEDTDSEIQLIECIVIEKIKGNFTPILCCKHFTIMARMI